MRRLVWALVASLVVPAWATIAAGEPTQLISSGAPSPGFGTHDYSASLDIAAPGAPPASAVAAGNPAWKKKINRIASGRSIGISVRLDGDVLFERGAKLRRLPASNEKLLLSMALYSSLGTDLRIKTKASSASFDGGVVDGDLYVLGTGDPTVAASTKYARGLPFRATRLGRLARRIRGAGVTKVTGSVVGSINYFSHDWFAPGWKSYFPSRYVALPSALTFNGNRVGGVHIADPEVRVARSLSKKLRKLGVTVAGPPAAGAPPSGLTQLAKVRSEPLEVLVGYMNRRSSNFFAEVLGKRLSVNEYGRPGTIAKAAAAVAAWADGHGVAMKAYDGSGLSYSNRISPRGVTRLMAVTENEPWGSKLRASLARGDQGTLEGRLEGVPLRAKTGTLTNVSTLSGWVYLKQRKKWAAFSILSSGMPKATAVKVEDRIVRILRRSAD
jgi:D-alanyl-D-alanine carboxypeptidase/D-alanyl-D-alanine-endopeptidase (penicillin-binding protein 4)